MHQHCDSPSHLRDLSPDGEPRMSSVSWVVSDIVEETARLAGHQCPVVMQGNIFDETFRTTWFDTSAMLGCYAEVFIEIGRAHAELQSLMRTSYAVFCLHKKNNTT